MATTLYQRAVVTEDHWVHVQSPQLPTGVEVGVVLILDESSVTPPALSFWERIQDLTIEGLPSDYSTRFEEYLQSEPS